MKTETNTQRDELTQVIFDSRKPWVTNSEHRAMEQAQADAILAAGYSKPRVIGYVVVARDGGMVTGASYTTREGAQFYADRWTADAKASRIDWEYRVAEIVEAAA